MSRKKKPVRVVWVKDGWNVIYGKDIWPFSTKAVAVSHGRSLARIEKTSLVIDARPKPPERVEVEVQVFGSISGKTCVTVSRVMSRRRMRPPDLPVGIYRGVLERVP